VRKPIRASVVQMSRAAESGDMAAYAAAAERGLALSRFVLHQFGIVSRLVGEAGSNLVCRRIRDDIMRGRVSGAAGAALLAAMRRQWSVPPRTIVIDSMRLDWRQMIANTHTDDGQGRGWLVLTSVADVPPWEGALAVLLAPRWASQRCGMQLLDDMQVIAGLPARSRADSLAAFQQRIARFDARYWIVSQHFQAGLASWSRWLETDDQVLMERAGTATMLAIEVFRAREGKLPESLEQVVPSVIESLPPDPHTGEALRYLRQGEPASPESSAGGRGYVLYSVWTDGADNGGKRIPQVGHEQAAIGIGWRSGFDFIVNDEHPSGGVEKRR
jgi:hypothetical protein